MHKILSVTSRLVLITENKVGKQTALELISIISKNNKLQPSDVQAFNQNITAIEFDETGFVTNEQESIKSIASESAYSEEEITDMLNVAINGSEKSVDSLNEARLKVKRKHGDDHPEIVVSKNISLRNKIIGFIGKQPLHRVSRKELKKYFNTLQEDKEVGKIPSFSWVNKNVGKYIKKLRIGNETYFKLTRASLNLLKNIQEAKVNNKLNEGKNKTHVKKKPVINRIIENNTMSKWKFEFDWEYTGKATDTINDIEEAFKHRLKEVIGANNDKFTVTDYDNTDKYYSIEITTSKDKLKLILSEIAGMDNNQIRKIFPE